MAVEYNYRKRITALRVGRLVTVPDYGVRESASPENRWMYTWTPEGTVYEIVELIPRPDRSRHFVRLGRADHLHPRGATHGEDTLQHQDNVRLVQPWERDC